MERRLIEVGLMDKSWAGREKIEKKLFTNTHTHTLYIYNYILLLYILYYIYIYISISRSLITFYLFGVVCFRKGATQVA